MPSYLRLPRSTTSTTLGLIVASACSTFAALTPATLSENSQEQPQAKSASTEKSASGFGIPVAWMGTWRGEMTSEGVNGKGEPFTMELEIAELPTANCYQWKITYRGQAGESIRDYELHGEDAAKGKYVIDERNGIRIPATLLGNSLHSHFSVQGTTLWTRYTLCEGPERWIEFEVVTASSAATLTSGGQGDAPAVVSLVPVSRQIGKLKPNVDQSSDLNARE